MGSRVCRGILLRQILLSRSFYRRGGEFNREEGSTTEELEWCKFLREEGSTEVDLDGGVLVVSTTSICFPHLSCPLLQTHLYISTIVFHPPILLHETVDVTKYIFSTTGALSAGQRSLPGQTQQDLEHFCHIVTLGLL